MFSWFGLEWLSSGIGVDLRVRSPGMVRLVRFDGWRLWSEVDREEAGVGGGEEWWRR